MPVLLLVVPGEAAGFRGPVDGDELEAPAVAEEAEQSAPGQAADPDGPRRSCINVLSTCSLC